MVLKDVDSESDSAQPVTPMPEIRRRKGMLFDEFTRKYPDWEWSDRRKGVLLRDEQGRIWVPMVDAAHGLRYEFDEPSLTAEAEDRLWELSERALAEVTAGGGVVFDPDEPDD